MDSGQWSAGGFGDQVGGPAFGLDGRLVASAGQDGSVRAWEVDGGRGLSSSAAVRRKCSSPDGRRLASSGSDDRTIVWDILQ